MNYTIKAKCDKDTFLNITESSLECKYKNGYTYGFYDNNLATASDEMSLLNNNINVEVFNGWDVDDFVTFNL